MRLIVEEDEPAELRYRPSSNGKVSRLAKLAPNYFQQNGEYPTPCSHGRIPAAESPDIKAHHRRSTPQSLALMLGRAGSLFCQHGMEAILKVEEGTNQTGI